MIENYSKLHYLLFMCFFIVFSTTQSQEIIIPASNTFFNGKTPRKSVTIVKPVNSDKINNAIKSFDDNGGVINIPSGVHTLRKIINLKSNVHIRVAKDAVLKPTSAFVVFDLGTNGGANQKKVTNVKISSTAGKFIIDYSNFSPGRKVAGFSVGWVENFMISGVLFKDNQTFLSGISVSPPSGGNWNRIAKNGIVINCSITNSDYGYGLVQVQAAENVLFKNLKGSGGVTLRFESGWKAMRDAGVRNATSTKLYGVNISGANGNAAVMVSPHTKRQGFAVIKNVTSTDCSFGIRIDKGFKEDRYPAGKYERVVVGGNIKITRNSNEGRNLAQIKQKHYYYYPTSFTNDNPFASFPKTKGTDPDARKAPSIAPMLFDAQNSATSFGGDGKYKVTFRDSGHRTNKQTYRGFRSCTPRIVYDNDKRKVCPTKKNNTNSLKTLSEQSDQTNDNFYPNPVKNGRIFFHSKFTDSTINIYSIQTGAVIKTIHAQNKNEIDVSDINPGTYILRTVSNGEVKTQKVIIE
ncbi:T9SS type A sorting domain-containing protein [Wenyingzhuangia sp. IMCC45533]